MNNPDMECPEWCTSTHDELPVQYHTSPVTWTGPGEARVFTYAGQLESRFTGTDPAHVRAVADVGPGPQGADFDAPSARALAAIVEHLAASTAADHKAFADALRANAELIDPELEAG